MAMTPEGRVKEAVKRVLKARDIYYYMPVSNGMGRVGAPDFICCHNGHFLAIETKAPGKVNNTTPNQRREISAITHAGGTAIVIDSATALEDMLNTL
jgi:hypothetical protein